MKLLLILYKCINILIRKISYPIKQKLTIANLLYHQADFNADSLNIYGLPIINMGKQSKFHIGKNVTIVSGIENGIDCTTCTKINIKNNAKLTTGSYSGLTNVAIQCHKSIYIGNYVNIGAGTMIFDTDFHSLNWEDRFNGTDIINRAIKPIVINDFAFIGTKCIIMKGVTIGKKSIVGAGSVVTKDIPENEIWAGNPAKFIRKINS